MSDVSVPFRGYVVVMYDKAESAAYPPVSVPFRGYVVVIVSTLWLDGDDDEFPSPFGVM